MMILRRLTTPLIAMALALPAIPMHAQYGPPPNAYGQNRGGWDAPPQAYRQYQRQGFQDGIEGARKDAENHRRPNVNNRDEFRQPNVPRQFRHDYRDGFRRGYNVGIQHLLNGRR